MATATTSPLRAVLSKAAAHCRQFTCPGVSHAGSVTHCTAMHYGVACAGLPLSVAGGDNGKVAHIMADPPRDWAGFRMASPPPPVPARRPVPGAVQRVRLGVPDVQAGVTPRGCGNAATATRKTRNRADDGTCSPEHSRRFPRSPRTPSAVSLRLPDDWTGPHYQRIARVERTWGEVVPGCSAMSATRSRGGRERDHLPPPHPADDAARPLRPRRSRDSSLAAIISTAADGQPAGDLHKAILRLRLITQAQAGGATWSAIAAAVGYPSGRQLKKDTHRLAEHVTRNSARAEPERLGSRHETSPRCPRDPRP